MQPAWKRWLVGGAKLALVLVILYFVGARFHDDLGDRRLTDIEVHPGWLVASGALYLIGMGPSAWFWRHLLEKFGYPLSLYAAVRAHYIGQLGKYVPGKALAILIRADLVRSCGVPMGVSVIASFYEVFTGMAAGAMVAAVVYLIEPPTVTALPGIAAGMEWQPLWLGLVLVGLCGVPLLPGVFNFLIARLTANIQAVQLYRLPPVSSATLAIGLVGTGIGWWMQGLSVWAMLQAVVPNAPAMSWSLWAQCTAGIAFATVAGFAFFIMPAGFGVREELLKDLLSSAGPLKDIASAVLLLRVVCIVTEAIFALCVIGLKPAGASAEPAESGAK